VTDADKMLLKFACGTASCKDSKNGKNDSKQKNKEGDKKKQDGKKKKQDKTKDGHGSPAKMYHLWKE